MVDPNRIENLIHNGRSLVAYDDPEDGLVIGWPEMAYESIRAINHLKGHGPIPAPTVYRILGDLKGVGHLLPQALEKLCRGLRASLAAFDVYDHSRELAESEMDAVALLARASRKAADLGQLLEDAQAAIAEQGYRTDDAHPSLFEDEGDLR